MEFVLDSKFYDSMEHLIHEDLSPLQLSIYQRRADGETDKRLKDGSSPLVARQISKCLLRSTLSFQWDFGQEAGQNLYLCPSDETRLCDQVREQTANLLPMTPGDVIEPACE
jgi:hypothetical protein